MPFQTFNYSGGGLGGPALANQYAQINQANELRRRYGTDDPIAIQDIVAQQANQDRMNQLQQAEQIKQQDASAQTDELARRNRMGLGSLSSMLNDSDSPLYQYEYDSGQKDKAGQPVYQTPEQMGVKTQISMGGLDGSAPADLPAPIVPMLGLGKRMLRPEYQGAFDSQSTNSNRTLTPEEYAARENLKSDLQMKRDQELADARQALAAQNGGVKVAIAQGGIQARDVTNTGKSNQIASDMATSAGLGLRRLPSQAAPAQTTDSIQMSVDPALSQLPPESQAKVKQYMQQYPNRSAGEIINAMKKSGVI